ncbi:MAG TPA: DUF349 domain-containing protein [Edaphocola sp.]|nr:DUF349 domain-containing protein [Edaphocola sp.]
MENLNDQQLAKPENELTNELQQNNSIDGRAVSQNFENNEIQNNEEQESSTLPKIESSDTALQETVLNDATPQNTEETDATVEIKTEKETSVDHIANLKNYWDTLIFPEKHLCKIDEKGNLFRIATKNFPEKHLGHIDTSNAMEVIKILTEKYQKQLQTHRNLMEEWTSQPDILKLQGKLERNKSHLLRAPVLGDVESILEVYLEKEAAIQNVLKMNIAARAAIVEKAVALKDSDEFRATSDQFKELVKEWKKAPHVEKEVSDKLWQEIEDARNAFYERKRANHEEVEKEMMQNLDLKLELCEKAEALAISEQWRATTDTFKELLEQWKEIGRVASREKNEELWQRFNAPKNIFFEHKEAHFTKIKAEQEANYIAKIQLIEQAEAIKDSTNWKETTDKFNKISEQWKAIGHVPKEHSDAIWDRMQAAKHTFFEAKRKHGETYRINLEDNYAQKQALVDRIEHVKNSTDWKSASQEVNELFNTWKTIGPIPREYGDELWEHFISARKHFYKRRDEDRKERRNLFLQRIATRITQSQQFLNTLEEELAEDESKLSEFKEILNGTGAEDAKDKEIKENLGRLIEQIERKMPSRIAKIEDVKKQIFDLEKKLEEEN